jgi:hypothetical protein
MIPSDSNGQAGHHMRPVIFIRLLVAALLLVPAFAVAQVKAPKPPERFDVQIRYRIFGDRNERVLAYEEMSKNFKNLGFVETEHDDNDLAAFDPNAQIMTGKIPAKTARDLLKDSRVQTILLTPEGFQPPAEEQRIRIAVELTGNREQLALYKQVNSALGTLGFRNDLGYDSRQFTLLRGTIPVSQVGKLIHDLRYQPSGWFLPTPSDKLTAKLNDGTVTPFLVSPFANQVPVRTVEILGLSTAPPEIVTLPPLPADAPVSLQKWTADLRRKLAEEGVGDKPIRLEVVLAYLPNDIDISWREVLTRSGAVIEGRLGPVVTVTVKEAIKGATLLAAENDVASVRLPRLSRSVIVPDQKDEAKENPLALMQLEKLHSQGFRGKGIRIVVIDTDFAGWETKFAKEKEAGLVTLLDLSAERNPNVFPEPMKGNLGHGTVCAAAVRLAAPEAAVTLVRVPVDASYEMLNVARFVRGESFRTEAILSRRFELNNDLENLKIQKLAAQEEYRQAFDNFEDSKAALDRRKNAQATLKKLEEAEKALFARLDRIEAIEAGQSALTGANVVLGLLTWNTGFALDGASTMSQYLNDWLVRPRGATYVRREGRAAPASAPLWFEPAGDTRGHTWTGLFRDLDGNGAMEFVPPSQLLAKDRWSRELNFLARRNNDSNVVDLKQGDKVRVSIQWREPHDPTLTEVDYRIPVASLKLQLVKQRDFNGEKYSSDEIDLIASSEGLPERLTLGSNFGVYEHSLEVTLPADGRYALRVEGQVPNRIRPPQVTTLPSQEFSWEIRPRIFVQAADGKEPFVLSDFASEDGGVSVPADSRGVYAVGAAGKDGKALPFSATGAGPLIAQGVKPDFLAPDVLPGSKVHGTAVAASLAAGWGASLLSTGLQPASFPQILRLPPGGLAEVPTWWIGK